MLLDELSWAHWMLHRANLHWSSSEAKCLFIKRTMTTSLGLVDRWGWGWGPQPHISTNTTAATAETDVHGTKATTDYITQTNIWVNHKKKRLEFVLCGDEALCNFCTGVPSAPFSAESRRSSESKFPTWSKQIKTHEYFILSKHRKTTIWLWSFLLTPSSFMQLFIWLMR